MNMIHLIKDKQLQNLLNRQISISHRYVKTLSPPFCDQKALLACSILCSQLIMIGAVNQLSREDIELDNAVAKEVMSMVHKHSLSAFDRVSSDSAARLQVRSRTMKGVEGVNHLTVWELKYWVELGTGLPKEKIRETALALLEWLERAVDDLIVFIQETPPMAIGDQHSEELDFGFLDLNIPNRGGL